MIQFYIICLHEQIVKKMGSWAQTGKRPPSLFNYFDYHLVIFHLVYSYFVSHFVGFN